MVGAKKMVALPPTGLSSAPLYPWIFWHLWKARNLLIYEEKGFSEEEVVLKAINDARSWMEAQLLLPKTVNGPQEKPIPQPNPEYTSCYVDAAWIKSGFCGLGWLLQDENKVKISEKKVSKSFVGSALIAETMAMQSALVDAQSAVVRQLNVFSDCKVLISLLISGNSIVEIRGLLHVIRELSVSFTSICFYFIPRLSNVAADSLAKAALLDVSSSPTCGG
ncbi:unnamed protein product [Arabidopsis arenosa]|uniref:RNase H type-1 domain-containing protein n=1 Tax=Arabidopsis arenosa TaxID=38785 RepID=A0A8S2B3F5_ARAAE|nr:unnamed protein product [Arabidopsis arenosa]